MDGSDSIDSVVLNQVLFKGFWVLAPVEELFPNQLYQGYLSLRLELTEYRSQPKQSLLEARHWLWYNQVYHSFSQKHTQLLSRTSLIQFRPQFYWPLTSLPSMPQDLWCRLQWCEYSSGLFQRQSWARRLLCCGRGQRRYWLGFQRAGGRTRTRWWIFVLVTSLVHEAGGERTPMPRETPVIT